jgi:hypothetical protein
LPTTSSPRSKYFVHRTLAEDRFPYLMRLAARKAGMVKLDR